MPIIRKSKSLHCRFVRYMFVMRIFFFFTCIYICFGFLNVVYCSELINDKAMLGENSFVLFQANDNSSDALIIVYFDGDPVQIIQHQIFRREDNQYLEVNDYNFDGHMDFSVFSSRGNVQIMYDVYLFCPETRKYVKSETMSNLPCISVNQEDKIVFGDCFHGNACSNWIEGYTVSWFDELSLVHESGTDCCAASESCYYTFERNYKDGKVISDEWIRHPEQVNINDDSYIIVKRKEDSSDSLITVYVNEKQVLAVQHNPYPVIGVEDFNMDGYMDFSIFREMVDYQQLYDVYLFNPETLRYVKKVAE